MLILRDPTPDASGGANPTPAPPPETPPTQNVLGGTTQPAPLSMIQLTAAEYERLIKSDRELATVQAQKRADAEAAEQQRIRLMAEKGDIEKALTTQEANYKGKLDEQSQKYTTLEQRFLGKAKSLAVAEGMANLEFASDFARADMQRSLEQDFVSRLDSSGEPAVVDPISGRPALEVIRERIKSGRYDHCLNPTSRGGNPVGSGHKPPPSEKPTDPDQARTERLKQLVNAARASNPGLAYTGNN
jgi:hypothetical protein